MSLSDRYRQQAECQRAIAKALPRGAARQRFLMSAERYDALVKAEEDLLARDAPGEDDATG